MWVCLSPRSSGVTAWMSQHTLGVTALRPGHGQWVAAPFVSEHLQEVAGVVPTVVGPIHVEAAWQADRVTVVVTAASAGRIGVLRAHTVAAGSSLVGVTVDGVDMPSSALDVSDMVDVQGALTQSQITERWFTELLPPGRHEVIARYTVVASVRITGASAVVDPPFPPFPAASFPVSSSNDTTTAGTGWLAKHGQDGYVLFGFDAGETRTKLPSYIKNVTFSLGSRGVTSENCTQSSAHCLQDPSDPSKRSLGGAAGMQVIDIDAALGTKYKLAVYCVAAHTAPKDPRYYAKPGPAVPAHPPSQALRVLDLSPGPHHLNPAALTIHVHDLEGGIWWVLEADRPLRFRVDVQFGAGNINALAFSPA